MKELDVMLMDATELHPSIQINTNQICLASREKTSHIYCPHYASSSSRWTSTNLQKLLLLLLRLDFVFLNKLRIRFSS